MFPIAILPRWTNPASYVLPPFWAAEALERATASGGLPAIVPIWIVTIALSAGYLAAAMMVFRLVTRRMALTGALTAG
jgi:ABC-2 type transport system permease protein